MESENGEISGIADDLLNNAPGVSEHVITSELQKEQERQENALVDASGATFDPNIHVSNDGEPVKTASGMFRKKSGRKAGGASDTIRTAPRSQIGNANGFQPGPPPVDPGTVAAGKAAAHLLFQAGIAIGGEEWQPRYIEEYGLNEATQIESAFIDYFKSQEITDFPPGVALSLAVISYAAPRFMMPKTKTRLEKVVDWFKGKFSRKKNDSEKEE